MDRSRFRGRTIPVRRNPLMSGASCVRQQDPPGESRTAEYSRNPLMSGASCVREQVFGGKGRGGLECRNPLMSGASCVRQAGGRHHGGAIESQSPNERGILC